MAGSLITIEVHGDCTVIADRSPNATGYIHYTRIVADNDRYTAAQVADAMRKAMKRGISG
jgi:hypothetical protein